MNWVLECVACQLRYASPERVSTCLGLMRLESLGFGIVKSPSPDTIGTVPGIVGTGVLIELTESLVFTCSIFRSCSLHGWAGDGEGENKSSRRISKAGDVRYLRYRMTFDTQPPQLGLKEVGGSIIS